VQLAVVLRDVSRRVALLAMRVVLLVAAALGRLAGLAALCLLRALRLARLAALLHVLGGAVVVRLLAQRRLLAFVAALACQLRRLATLLLGAVRVGRRHRSGALRECDSR